MADWVCDRDCQVRMPDNAIRHCMRGDILVWPDDSEDSPPEALFRPVKAEGLDFATASEAELKVAKWSYKALNEFTTRVYKKAMPKLGKDAMINTLLDMRLRTLEV